MFEFWLNIHWSLFLRIQLTITQPQWFKTWYLLFHNCNVWWSSLINTWHHKFIIDGKHLYGFETQKIYINLKIIHKICTYILYVKYLFIVRRAGLLWSQQDFEWRWSVPLFKCLTVLEFSFILFDLCLLITFFNFIMNYVPIVTFWIFTYHKIWILSITFCSIWSYWIIYFLACLEVSWRVVS